MGKNSKFLRELKRLEQAKNKSSSLIEYDKMSKVLEDFMSPYLHLTTNLTSKQKLFTIGVVAWNASLYPEAERDGITDLLFSEEVIGDEPTMQEELKEIVQELIQRKLAYFNHNQRLIIDFDLQKVGNSYELSVISQKIS